MKAVECVILALLIVLLVAAIVWEYQDMKRVMNLTPIYDLEEQEDIEQACTEYSCYPAEQGISWRLIYISTFVASIIVMIIIPLL